MTQNEDWKPLLDALEINGPLAEYKILQIAAKRINALKDEIKTEHEDCIRVAKEVLPNEHMHFAHQTAWAMNAEIQRLRAQIKELTTKNDELWRMVGQRTGNA